MSVDPRTVGWLSRALTHEMSAVQQYLAQSVLAHLWGDETLATYLRAEAVEEMGHAERLMQRLIRVGVAPAAANLAPARLGRSVDQESLLKLSNSARSKLGIDPGKLKSRAEVSTTVKKYLSSIGKSSAQKRRR
jgi:bacterioferritin (cytochrome b1)